MSELFFALKLKLTLISLLITVIVDVIFRFYFVSLK